MEEHDAATCTKPTVLGDEKLLVSRQMLSLLFREARTPSKNLHEVSGPT
jgi:hypothetical protein